MKKKLLIYGTASILLLTVLIAMDRFKLYKEEKPPLTIITVDGQEIPSIPGESDWHGTKTRKIDPIKAMAGMNPFKLKEKEKLEVSFRPEMEPVNIIISQVNAALAWKKSELKGTACLFPKALPKKESTLR